ncbi:MAG: hypothetical protein HW376_874 [candidate division NC10 bacterium]|nr:hypothetical protein [candidate division NC10 bacterium]
MLLFDVRMGSEGSSTTKKTRQRHRAVWSWLLLAILSFTMIARNYRCEPSVMAVDREGRSALVTLTIRSDGVRHVFSIPDLGIRRYLEPGQEATIEFLAERSGVFDFGCTRFPVITPLDHKGKLAIR